LYCFYSPAGVEYGLRAERPETGTAPAGTGIVTAVLARLERRAINHSHRVVVLSEFSRSILEENHGRAIPPVVIIPAGVDLERFHPSTNRAAIKKKLNLPRDVPLLLTIRDLEQRMGIDSLLQALADLHKDRRLFCIIGGSGPMRSFLEDRAAQLGIMEVVRFLGHIPEDELPLYYQAADLFVLPTRAHEGFGLVTVEALACGTPVLATPVGASPEILAPLDARLVTTSASAQALTESMRRVLDLTSDVELHRRCRAHVENRYSWTRHVKTIEKKLFSVRDEMKSRR
jgi:glycosyltransferase involved in cell wall biosynthesis